MNAAGCFVNKADDSVTDAHCVVVLLNVGCLVEYRAIGWTNKRAR